MNPKHIKCIPEDKTARAPYNFVELPDTVATILKNKKSLPDFNSYSPDHITGKLECTLTTASPLYIRCGLKPSDFEKEKSNSLRDLEGCSSEERARRTNFFTNPATPKPVLPGSSIRGMLRTLIEVVGYGKLDKVADLQLIYRAVGDTSSLGESYRNRLTLTDENRYTPLVRAGYMRQVDSTWKISPAKSIIDNETFARIEKNATDELTLQGWHNSQNSYQINVSVQQPKFHLHKAKKIKLWYAKAEPLDQQENTYNAVLVKTGNAPKKHMDFVFGIPDDESDSWIAIPNDVIQDYKDQITDGQKSLLGDDCALQNMQPIFYLEDENSKLVFFGHTMMFRLPYETSLRNFLPSNLKSETSDPQLVDLAESLFGYVRDCDSEEKQIGKGKLSITDAICISEVSKQTIKPKILGGPKPTTFQHYLVQPEETKARKKDLKHYASDPKSVLRGHKFYWHKHNVATAQIKESDIGKLHKSKSQYTEIQLIESGVQFQFAIHFENLSNVELGALLWVLNLAQDEKYRLSLGMGKPLGMGAVKIEHQLYLNQREERYQKLFAENGNWLTGYANEPSPTQHYIDEFDRYIRCQIGATDEGSLKDVRRIKMLLAMLSWGDAPDSEQTRYLEIECNPNKTDCIAKPRHGKNNEYAERPVLPTPLQVIGWEDCNDRNNGNLGGSGGGGGTLPNPPKQQKKGDKSKSQAEKKHSSSNQGRQTSMGAAFEQALQRPPKPPKKK